MAVRFLYVSAKTPGRSLLGRWKTRRRHVAEAQLVTLRDRGVGDKQESVRNLGGLTRSPGLRIMAMALPWSRGTFRVCSPRKDGGALSRGCTTPSPAQGGQLGPACRECHCHPGSGETVFLALYIMWERPRKKGNDLRKRPSRNDPAGPLRFPVACFSRASRQHCQGRRAGWSYPGIPFIPSAWMPRLATEDG
jgi:hypothetical protein